MGQEVAIEEPVRVAVRTLSTGRVAPKSFEWQGRRHDIVELGRQWDELIEGKRLRRFLVQTPGQNAYELRWDPLEDEWILYRGWIVNIV